MLAPYAGAALPDVAISPSRSFMLIFTSGTTGAPKAVMMSQGRLCGWGNALADELRALTGRRLLLGDAAVPLERGGRRVHRTSSRPARSRCCGAGSRRAACSPDVRKHGVTFFNYVGKPLTYILATPEQPDDADNSLNFAFGNEAAPLDIDRFAQRFGCIVVDGYGSTEGGVEHEQVDRHAAGLAGQADRGERRRAHLRSRDERGVPARRVRRDGPVRQRRGSDRRDGEREGLRRVRGLLQERRGQRRTHARRHVLDRRPRLPRRRRVLLLRGPQFGLAPRRRRELRGRARRERARASLVRRPVPRSTRCRRSTSATT